MLIFGTCCYVFFIVLRGSNPFFCPGLDKYLASKIAIRSISTRTTMKFLDLLEFKRPVVFLLRSISQI